MTEAQILREALTRIVDALHESARGRRDYAYACGWAMAEALRALKEASEVKE